MESSTRIILSCQKARRSKGQMLVILALALIAIVAVIGLAIDTGLLFVHYNRLRLAVDAAALSASLQFREGYTPDDLSRAALEFLKLNGINDPSATVDTCDTDPTLCPGGIPRKMVRVNASGTVQLVFLPVIGINQVPIRASAIAEAASVDVILVLDASYSMAFETDPSGNPNRADGQRSGEPPYEDTSFCNTSADYPCEPFHTIKQLAKEFVNQLYFPYDRVGIVTFAREATLNLPLTNDPGTILSSIDNLTVFSPPPCDTEYGSCRKYDPPEPPNLFLGYECPAYRNTHDPSSCTNSNIGGGWREAGNAFVTPPENKRDTALWVVVTLVGGPANATDSAEGAPFGLCPSSTWSPPFCRDRFVSTRHCGLDAWIGEAVPWSRCTIAGGSYDPSNYDADDFARDMADFLGVGQSAIHFSIGLGNLVRNAPVGDPNAGEALLQYAAEVGNGLYYYAPDTNQLADIFRAIAQNIATRLAR